MSLDITQIVHNYNPHTIRQLTLYRSLQYGEEKEAYRMIIEEPNETIMLYTSRNNHRYYFSKFNGQVYHIVTNESLTVLFSIRIIDEL